MSAIVLVGADRVIDVVRQLAEAGTGAAIVLASGFGEAGAEGQRRQQELKEAAGSMRILGPNTIGLVNLTDGITLSASGALEMDEPPDRKHRARLAERRHPGLAAVASGRPRHRLLQACRDRQRGRSRCLGHHRPSAGRRRHLRHRALSRRLCGSRKGSAQSRPGPPAWASRSSRSRSAARKSGARVGGVPYRRARRRRRDL